MLVITLIVWVGPARLFAQSPALLPPVIMTDAETSVSLADHFLVYEAPRGSVDHRVAPALYRSGAFRPLTQRNMMELDGKNEYWLVFQVTNNSSEELKILNLDWYRISKIAVYMPDCSSPDALHNRTDHTMSFNLNLKRGSTCTIFIEAGQPFFTKAPPRILSPSNFYSDLISASIYFSLYSGLLITLILYHIIIFSVMRDRNYLLYTLVLFMLLIQALAFNGYFQKLDILTDPDPFRLILHGTWAYSYILTTLFIYHVSIQNTTRPEVSRWVRRLIGLSIVSGLLFLILDMNESRLSAALAFGFLLVAASSLLAWFIIVRGILMRHRQSVILAIAFGSFLLGAFVFAAWEMLLIPHNVITKNSSQIGAAIQALLFAFVLSHRINSLRLERIAAQKSALKSKELAFESLKKASQIKDEFLSKTSHELRTPLQCMIALSDYLLNSQNPPDEEERINSLELIRLSAKRLSLLVHDLLDYAKMKDGELALNNQAISLADIVDATISLQKVLLHNDALCLKANISEEILVLADENRLSQIFQNLLNNAIRFTDAGTICISANQSRNSVTISVDDTGVGIPPNLRQAVFEDFRQIGGGERGGTGLGLAITKRLIEAHGGEIWIEQGRTGTGTCIIFTLPAPTDAIDTDSLTVTSSTNPGSVISPPIKNIASPNTRAQSVDEASHLPEQKNDKNRSILLVDDDPIVLESVSRLLTLEGYVVVTASSAYEARTMLRSRSFDLAIVDIMMPGESGYDLCRYIRTSHSPLELPVLLLSARNGTDDLMLGINAGANDYSAKPINGEELFMRLRGLFRMRDSYQGWHSERKARVEALQNERNRIYGDLHDNIASYLTDLILLTKRTKNGEAKVSELIVHAERLAAQSMNLLRERLQYIEDLSRIDDDFLESIELILYNRYRSIGRRLNWTVDNADLFARWNSADSYQDLFAMINEVTNNDLKYGYGSTLWKVSGSSEEVHIHMEAPTRFDFSRNRLGRGTALLQARSSKIGGVIWMDIKDGRFQFKLSLPATETESSVLTSL